MGGDRRGTIRLIGGDAKLDGDSRVMLSPDRRSAPPGRLRSDPHEFLDSVDLVGFDLDPPLPLGAALEVVDGHRLAAEDERTGIRPGEPVVEARPGNAQASGCIGRGQQFVRHNGPSVIRPGFSCRSVLFAATNIPDRPRMALAWSMNPCDS